MYALYVTHEDLSEEETTRSTGFYTDRFSNITRIEEAVGYLQANIFLMEYNEALNPRLLSKRTTPSGSTEYTYNEQGNVASVKDPQDNVTVYEYAEDIDVEFNPAHANLLRKVYRPEVTVPGEMGPEVVQYDPTELQYDELGNLERILDARGEETIFGIRPDGQIGSLTDRRGYTTLFRYNDDLSETDRGLLREIETPGDGTDNPARITQLRYDPVYDNVVEVEDPLGNIWTTAYDALDRPLVSTDARGNDTLYSYLDGLLEELELPANQGSGMATRKTNYVHDDPGRLKEVYSDIDATSQQLRVAYEYNCFSNLKRLTRLMNEVEKHTEYDYDWIGRVIEIRDPLHTTETPRRTLIERDPFCASSVVTTPRGNNLSSVFDSRCQQTQLSSAHETCDYDYDELGRLISSTQSHDSRYKHDPSIETEDIYRYARYGSSTKVRTYAYDELDRLVKVTFEDEGTQLYAYDEESNLVEMTDTAGNVCEYVYYKDNRLAQVILKRAEETDRVFTYRYDEAGRLRSLEYPEDTGIVANFGHFDGEDWVHGWNENGQLTFLDYRKGGVSIQSFSYDHDDSGNRKQLVDTPAVAANQVVWDYTYDRLNRLSGVTRSMPEADPVPPQVVTVYSYDESDNRTEFQYTVGEDPTISTTYLYNLADEITERWVDELLAETFTHDKDGNMVSRTLEATGKTTRYLFDEWNRLSRIELSPVPKSKRVYSRYDNENIRKSRTAPDGTVSTYRYGGLAVSNEVSAPPVGPEVQTNFFSGHQVLGLERSGDFYYFLTDGLSSVRLVVDEDGDVVASYDADEFGNPFTPGGSDPTITDQRWVGGLGYKDEVAQTGLYYLRQRYYDPIIGRFVSRDPIGTAGGFNHFAYAGNQPIDRVDPLGLRQYIIYKSGLVEYFEDQMADFHKQIQYSNPGDILMIIFSGHGSKRNVHCDRKGKMSDDHIGWNDATDDLYLHYGGKTHYDFDGLLRNKQIKRIELRSCGTAGGDTPDTATEKNIARAVARLVPGTMVVGSRGNYEDPGPHLGLPDVERLSAKIQRPTYYLSDKTGNLSAYTAGVPNLPLPPLWRTFPYYGFPWVNR